MGIAIFALITVALSAARQSEPTCSTNEVFRRCRGCETTCEDVRRGNIPKICTLQCRPAGCQCIDGFVRDDSGQCSRPGTCTKCQNNEVLKSCGACDTTCDQALKDETAICTADCREPSCGCKDGFYRNARRLCVRKYQCEPACEENEQRNICGSCDTSCEQALRGETAICTRECRAPDCGCKSGFFRDEDHKCVTKLQCRPNDEPNKCGLLTGPPLPNIVCGPGILRCPAGYICKTGSSGKGVCCKSPITVLCKDGSEPFGSQSQCGLGGGACPPDFECQTDPVDRYAICCPKKDPIKDVCGPDSRPPLPNINCGRGGTRCPTGYFCKIHPADRYAVCCPVKRISPCNPNLCPSGQICTPSRRPCLPDEIPCLPFVCSEPPYNPCIRATCDRCSVCVPDIKPCPTTLPCPQFKCIPRERRQCRPASGAN